MRGCDFRDGSSRHFQQHTTERRDRHASTMLVCFGQAARVKEPGHRGRQSINDASAPGIAGAGATSIPSSGLATAAKYPIQTKVPNSTNQAVVPSRVNPPVIFEPPAALTNIIANVFAAVSGGLAPVFKLMEMSATGVHSTNQAYTSSLALGASVSFSISVQAAERTACRLNFFNGAVNIGCDFNLTAGTAGPPDAGIASVNIAVIAAGPPIWYH